MNHPQISEIKTTLSGKRQVFDCECIRYAAGETVVSYRMPAERAYQLGLVDELLPTPADLLPAAEEMAHAMLANSHQAMALG